MGNLISSIPFVRYLLLFGIFILFGSSTLAALSYARQRAAVNSAMRSLLPASDDPELGTRLRIEATTGAWARMAATIERAGLNLGDTNEERLSARLKAAGYPSPNAPRIFTLIRLLLVFAFPSIYVLLTYVGGNELEFFKLYVVGALLALLGLYLPNLYIRVKVDRRQEAIVHGFPDCLDLLLVCVESGLGLEAAMDRVGREMVLSHPQVAALLSSTTLRLRAGSTREEAYRMLSKEAAVDEIRSFTTLLIQSDKLGTSIATTLRVYAAEMRERRRMRAEEKAHRLPVLISIPLVVCMLPVMIGVLMLPAAIRVMREVLPLLNGG